MIREEFNKVLEEEHIVRNGERLAWTIPIAFPAKEDYAKSYKVGEEIAVIAPSGEVVGSMLIAPRGHGLPTEQPSYPSPPSAT